MGLSERAYKLKAILYLHALRTWRYKYSFINGSINTMLWVTIFLLGAILFAKPEDLPRIAPVMFWGVSAWNIVSYTVLFIAGWTTWFLVTTGLVEEHFLHNTSLSTLLSGRLVSVVFESVIAIALVYFVLSSVVEGMDVVDNPLFIVYGLACMVAMALGYGLVLSAAGLRLSIPGTLLDISNFVVFIVGGIATPIEMLPKPLRLVAIAIPYSHAAEVLRYGAVGIEPYLGLGLEAALSGILAAGMLAAGLLYYKYVEDRYVRIHGVKGIGRM
jgi:ABC-2 type transport system permease protein